jgi:transcription elongation GreA/GreB family factor
MVGTRVTVRTDDGMIESYALVSPGAANARGSSISPESPVGAALMGRLPGETVHVTTPAGTLALQIVSVEVLAVPLAQHLECGE